MSDIKQVKYDIPAPVAKTRRGRPRTATAANKTPKAPRVANKIAKPALSISTPVNTPASQKTSTAATPVVINSVPSAKLNDAKTLQTAVNSVANKKKPTVNVNLPYLNSPHTPSPTHTQKPQQSPVKVNEKPAVSTTRKVIPRVTIKPTKRKNFTMKRKFVARHIMIDIENANKSNKKRDSIEKKVANMPLCDITKNLRENGIVRPDINPPEKMQRSMMIDLLMFPVPQ
jgi:hypothetical protein